MRGLLGVGALDFGIIKSFFFHIVRDRYWPKGDGHLKHERTAAFGESGRSALPRKHLLEFTLSSANSRLPQEDHRLLFGGYQPLG